MENNILDNTNEKVSPKRSTFLTVLCILTFIGSTLGILGGIVNYISAPSADMLMGSAQGEMEQAMEEAAGSGEPGAEFAQKLVTGVMGSINSKTIRDNALSSIVASLFTLFGALMMWKLRSMGFWIYVAGTVIGVVAPIIIYQGNWLGGLSAIMIGFVGVIFIVLYGINKKQLVY